MAGQEVRKLKFWTIRGSGVRWPEGRLNEDVAAPYYFDGSFTRDYVQAYRYPGARTGAAVLNFLGSDTDLSYAYTLDARDFNGSVPSTSGSSLIQMAFWLCPSDWDDTDTDNILGLSLRDAMDQTVFSGGLHRRKHAPIPAVRWRLPDHGIPAWDCWLV